MIPEKLEERLKTINPSEGLETNCVGTAMYLAGLGKSSDTYQDPNGINEIILEMLEITENPKQGDLVAWHDSYSLDRVYHLAIIESVSPLRIMHRERTGGKFVARESPEVVDERLKTIMLTKSIKRMCYKVDY